MAITISDKIASVGAPALEPISHFFGVPRNELAEILTGEGLGWLLEWLWDQWGQPLGKAAGKVATAIALAVVGKYGKWGKREAWEIASHLLYSPIRQLSHPAEYGSIISNAMQLKNAVAFGDAAGIFRSFFKFAPNLPVSFSDVAAKVKTMLAPSGPPTTAPTPRTATNMSFRAMW